MASPTERTLKYLRKQGLYATVVERWNPHAHIRQDLYGIIDVLAVGKGITMGVQCTSNANVSARVKKIADHPSTPHLRDAGWTLHIHGWTKGKRGEPRIIDVS